MKSTKAEIELRVSTVAEMIVKGYAREKILRYSAENWNIAERQAENYLQKAWNKIKESTSRSVKEEIALQKARLEDLYEKNYKIQDYREARQVLDSTAKLLGLYAPTKKAVDHTTGGKEIQPNRIEIIGGKDADDR